MGRKRKDDLIAEAHKNPEYAAMPAKKLAELIDADQTTICKWRRKMKAVTESFGGRGRVLKPKVTVDSVRRKWEEKYAALNKQYDYLADRLVEMAKNADKHRNRESNLETELEFLKSQYQAALDSAEHYRKLWAEENTPWYKRLFS